MSLSSFALGEPAISQAVTGDGGKKPPPKRQITAQSDRAMVPEPR